MTDIARKSFGSDGAFEAKGIEGFEIKDADRGEVVAIVSTMNVVDRDGDVVLPGAIKDGAQVKLSSYEHDVITEGKAPVGRGTVTIEGDRAVLKAHYFMSTERGRDAFNTVKEMGPDTEWSIGFSRQVKTAPMTPEWKSKGASRLIAGLTLLESSPVFMGANGLTGTVSAKAMSDPEDASPQEQEGTDKYGDVAFADPTNKKYPIDTEEHIRAAWSYINQQANADKYTAAEVDTIKNRIVAAWKDKIDNAGPPSAMPAKSQMVRDLIVELKEARTKVADLEAEHSNAVAKEIFDRFRKNFKA